jgi:hypothetical protein
VSPPADRLDFRIKCMRRFSNGREKTEFRPANRAKRAARGECAMNAWKQLRR